LTEDEEIARIRAEYRRRDREIPAERYDLSRPAPRFAHERLNRAIVEALQQAGKWPPAGLAVADIGCGDGARLGDFARWGADPRTLHGIDLDERRLAAARRRLPPAGLVCGDGRRLPWPTTAFDVVLQFLVFSSVLLASVRERLAAEALRVLKPDGVLLWYDSRHSNPRNPNMRGVCADEIRTLFPGCDVRLRSVTLAPPLARAVVPVSPRAARLLERLPFLRTHLFGVVRRPAPSNPLQ
jgi:ubiquinone/menaquinone biosynthesis C-methylase UbiE